MTIINIIVIVCALVWAGYYMTHFFRNQERTKGDKAFFVLAIFLILFCIGFVAIKLIA